MGRKIDSLLKRSTLKASKFKPLVNLALHRLAVLKNQRQVRFNIAKSDVVEILKMGFQDRALLRVEHVIKEHNMLDVLHMIEGYLNLVLERFHVIEQDKICPEELKEAISSLLFAASRCGEFPELQEIRTVFTLHYGKEFAARAIELRNNCGVSTKLIQKLSTRMPSLESRTSVLKQIADENGFMLQLGESSVEEGPGPSVASVMSPETEDASMDKERFFEPGIGKKYENAADAAQAAFESAAYAAHAARAAVVLSRGGSHDSSNDSSIPFTMRKMLQNQQEDAELGTKTETKEISSNEELCPSFEDEEVDSDTQENEDAKAGLKKSVCISCTSSDILDSDEMSHTDQVEQNTILNDLPMDSTLEKSDEHAEANEVENITTMDDPPKGIITHELADDQVQDEAANSQGTSISEDPPVNRANEESWIRQRWNSKIDKMKRPFSHRSRGLTA